MASKHRHPKILDSLIDRIRHLQGLALDPKTPILLANSASNEMRSLMGKAEELDPDWGIPDWAKMNIKPPPVRPDGTKKPRPDATSIPACSSCTSLSRRLDGTPCEDRVLVAPVLTLRPDATSCPWLYKKPTKEVERDTNPAILSKHQKDAYCRCPQCWQKLGSNSITLSTYARAKRFCGYRGAGRLSVMTLSELLECAVQDYLDTHEQEIK